MPPAEPINLSLAAREGRKSPPPWIGSNSDEAVAADFGFSILIVDDAEDARYVYEKYFTFRGARAMTAEDGVMALRAVRNDPPDVILLDLAMPKVTGWEVLARLKAEPSTRDIPVLVLSGQGERESSIRAGADAYCDKPCPPDSVAREILRLLANKRGR